MNFVLEVYYHHVSYFRYVCTSSKCGRVIGISNVPSRILLYDVGILSPRISTSGATVELVLSAWEFF